MSQQSSVHPFFSRFVFALLLFVIIAYSSLSQAGEIYGRVAREGKVFPNAEVTIGCPSFSGPQTTTTDRNGVYRFPSGPPGEEQCQVSVSGSPNSVTIYTSKRRTKANLEIVKDRLRKR